MSSSYELLCYTREATGREKANNEDIAYSMHLALRADGAAQWEPLNENYGIFFAAGVPIQAATAESRRACVAAAHFVADPFDEAHPATDAVATTIELIAIPRPSWARGKISRTRAALTLMIPAAPRP